MMVTENDTARVDVSRQLPSLYKAMRFRMTVDGFGKISGKIPSSLEEEQFQYRADSEDTIDKKQCKLR